MPARQRPEPRNADAITLGIDLEEGYPSVSRGGRVPARYNTILGSDENGPA